MNLVRFNNHPNYSRLFNELFNENDYRYDYKCNNSSSPATNIIENEDRFELAIAVPGINKKDIKISLEKNLLTISTEKEESSKESSFNFTRKEFGHDSFSRSFTIPKSVDAEKIKADYNNGILNIQLPKKEEEKVALSREIKIG